MGSRPSKSTVVLDIVAPKPAYVENKKRLRGVPDHLIDECRAGIKTLNLSENYIENINEDIAELTGLRYVDLSHNHLSWISNEFFELPSLTYVNLSDNNLTSISGIGSARKSQYLNISKNQFSKLWRDVFKLSNLTNFLVAENKLSIIPIDISKLRKLRCLDWGRNNLESAELQIFAQLPISMQKLILATDCSSNPVLAISVIESICTRLKSMSHLDLRNNHLDIDILVEEKGFLHSVTLLSHLVYLNVEGNDIKALPNTFCKLLCLSTCILTNNEIEEFREVQFTGLNKLTDFHFDQNSVNDIREIPFAKMALCYLYANNNKIQHLPKQLERPSLKSLHLDFNDLTDLTHIDFNNMKKLKKLSLRSNRIISLPTSLFNAKKKKVPTATLR